MSPTSTDTDLFVTVARLLSRVKVTEQKDRWITGSQTVRCFVSFPTYRGGCFVEVKLDTEAIMREELRALAEHSEVALLDSTGKTLFTRQLSPGGIVSFDLSRHRGATKLALR